jgi:MFS family permease
MLTSYTSFLRNYYLSSSLYDFIFAYAIYTVLFSINGLSPFEISLILAWWAFTLFVLEIPSGALADYWSRKKLLMTAPLIKSLCFIIWYFADGNIYLYGLGFLFWSIGSTFVSGTAEALLYDHIVYYNRRSEYEKVLGKKKFYFYVGQAIAVTLGGIIAHYSLEWTLLFSVIPLLLSSFFASFIKEVPKIQSTEEIHYLDHFKRAYKEVKSNKKLFFLFIFSMGISISGNIEEFDQLYFELVHLPIFYFGFLGTIYFVIYALGSNYAYLLKNQYWIFWVFPFLSAVCFILAGVSPSLPMIMLIMLAYLFVSPLSTLNDAKVQHCITSGSRATVTSVDSLLINVLGVFFIIASGIVSKIWNLQVIYIATGISLIVFALWSFARRKMFREKD